MYFCGKSLWHTYNLPQKSQTQTRSTFFWIEWNRKKKINKIDGTSVECHSIKFCSSIQFWIKWIQMLNRMFHFIIYTSFGLKWYIPYFIVFKRTLKHTTGFFCKILTNTKKQISRKCTERFLRSLLFWSIDSITIEFNAFAHITKKYIPLIKELNGTYLKFIFRHFLCCLLLFRHHFNRV